MQPRNSSETVKFQKIAVLIFSAVRISSLIFVTSNSAVDVTGTSTLPCLVRDPVSQSDCWHHSLASPLCVHGTEYICLC
jgi:hypothetical protein